MSNQEPQSGGPVGRERLVEEFLGGTMPRQLAARYGVTEDWVYDELLAEFRERERELELEIKFSSQQYLSRLRRIEQAACEAWDRSCQPKTKRVVKEVRDAKGERTETTTTTEQSAGDPRHLALALKCLERRVAWRNLLQVRIETPAIIADFRENPQAALRRVIAQAQARQEAVEARRRQAAEIERTMTTS